VAHPSGTNYPALNGSKRERAGQKTEILGLAVG
jgi:hypothetical protein